MFINNCLLELKQYGTTETIVERKGVYKLCALIRFFFFGHSLKVIACIFFVFGAVEEQAILASFSGAKE